MPNVVKGIIAKCLMLNHKMSNVVKGIIAKCLMTKMPYVVKVK
jgi:hypothetical protein